MAFLKTIDEAGDRGADSEQLVKALKLIGPKGIGGTSVPINSMLEKLGFKVRHVYDNSRNNEGKRFWTKGRMFNDAFEAVRKQAN
mgnify:FL=1